MITFHEFTQQVTELYQHLYDLVYLRTSPLVNLLVKDPSLNNKEKGWKLHTLLLNAIEELNPGTEAPAFSREWRRYRLMKYRYNEGLDAQNVATEIAVSRRQYYREHQAAIEAIAEVLWQQAGQQSETALENQTENQQEWLNVLHSEAALLAQTDEDVDLLEVMDNVVPLFNDRLDQQKIVVDSHLLNIRKLPSISKYLLRQILIEILSYFINHLEQNTIHITSSNSNGDIKINFFVKNGALVSNEEIRTDNIISTLEVMSGTINANFNYMAEGDRITGFNLTLATEACKTVLAIDDNVDILALFERYLENNPKIHLLTAQSVSEGLSIAAKMQPDLIILDLMMPDRDGWEGLQIFKNNLNTSKIPIVVCSVMKQKELALSLGANYFIEKPIVESKLLELINDIFG